MSIVSAIIIVAVCGILGGAILVLASHFMFVKEDDRIAKVLEVMPGANCGACGYAGCADYAKAIVEGAPVNKCIPGGEACANAAANIMGVESKEVSKRKAVVACQGNYNNTQDKYTYQGIKSCSACSALYGGSSMCDYGCLGYGDCVNVCKFNAITVENGVAVIDNENCTGCGACEIVCPKNIIWVRPENDKPIVLCANKDKGALTRKACTAGCIGCMKCKKECPVDAIEIKNNVARIDYEKCIGCKKCVKVCPVGAIAVSA